jgi:hypothetical protein
MTAIPSRKASAYPAIISSVSIPTAVHISTAGPIIATISVIATTISVIAATPIRIGAVVTAVETIIRIAI